MEITVSTWALYVIVALITVLSPFSVQRFVAFRTACVKFRSTVLDILIGLYPDPVNWPNDGNAINRTLQAAFPALQIAVAEFRKSLPIWHRHQFDLAWLIYQYGSDGTDKGKHYYQYMRFGSPDTTIPDSKFTFHANVTRLLSFAKYA
jgi:hypothetical protein